MCKHACAHFEIKKKKNKEGKDYVVKVRYNVAGSQYEVKKRMAGGSVLTYFIMTNSQEDKKENRSS